LSGTSTQLTRAATARADSLGGGLRVFPAAKRPYAYARFLATLLIVSGVVLACGADVQDMPEPPSCPGDPACYTGQLGDPCGRAINKYCGTDDATGFFLVCEYSDGECGALDGDRGVCGGAGRLPPSACDGTTIGCDGVIYKTECQAINVGHTEFSTRLDLPCDNYPAPPRNCGLGPQTFRPCEYCRGRPVQSCRALSNGLKQIICEGE
jgi:hypothetical protein